MRTIRTAVLFFLFALVTTTATAAVPSSCAYTSAYGYSIIADPNCAEYQGCAIESVEFRISDDPWRPAACITSVRWDFGDGSPRVFANGGERVRHVFAPSPTPYTVTAMVTTTANGSAPTYRRLQIVDATIANAVDHSSHAAENAGTAKVTVVRTSSTGKPVTLRYQTQDYTARAGERYVASSGTITIAADQTSASFTIPLIDDAYYTGTQSFHVRITGAPGSVVYPGFLTTSVEVVDDELPPAIGFAAATTTVTEDAGVARVAVARSGDVSRSGTVHYSIPEFLPSRWVIPRSGSLTFDPGEREKTVDVPIVNDDLFTGQRQLYMRLHTPSAGTVLLRASATLVINDDEPPALLSFDPTPAVEGDTGPARSEVVVRLSEPVSRDAMLMYELRDETAERNVDYRPLSSTGGVSVPAGHLVARIPFEVLPDLEPEDEETFSVRVTLVIGEPWNGTTTTAPALGIITIIDNDAGMGPAQQSIQRGGTGSAFIDVGAPVASETNIPLASSNPAAVSVPPHVTIAAGQSRGRFEIRALTAGTSAAVSAVAAGKTHSIAVTTFEGARLVFSPAGITTYVGQEVSVRATLEPPSPFPQTIPLTVLNRTIAGTPAAVTIPAGGSGTFVVKALARGGTSVQATLPSENNGGVVALTIDVDDAPNTPSLAKITPATGSTAGGTEFEAHGARLTADCTILFGGMPAGGVKLVSNGLLTGTTPASAAGTVDVVLECGTTRHVLTNGFTFVAAQPSLRSIAPSFGSAAGGTHVRAIGANLYSGCWLFFGDTPARGVVTSGTTEMTAVVPAGKAGSVDLTVKCGSGSATMKSAFTYAAADEPSASIASIDPLSGAPGEQVTITGSRFRPGDRVTFDSAAATIIRTAPDTHVVRIPELPLGRSSVTLTDPNGRVTTTGPIFRILEPTPPRVERIMPSRATRGSELVLEGRGFRPGYTFAIGGDAARIVSLDATRVVLRVGARAENGQHEVEVVNGAGQVAAVGPIVTIAGEGIVVDQLAPACATSDGNIEVTISGSGFAPGAAVTFNGAAARNVIVVSATELRVRIPASATGTARVVVSNPSGESGSSTDGFRYYSPFDPDGGCAARLRAVRR